MAAYYNEIDPYAAQWLRNLIAAGHIAAGDVDERSIVDVRADDLRGYTQCHFFAGIGVWSYSLRLAGWPDNEPVWTGSCPCQSFSAAGSRRGFDDERHLWPHWQRLIRELGPNPVFGEQVASQDGLAWLDFVCADMEAAGYSIGAIDTCAAGFGAPHIRQRIYFVADSGISAVQWDTGSVFGEEEEVHSERLAHGRVLDRLADGGDASELEYAYSTSKDQGPPSGEQSLCDERGASLISLGDSESRGCGERRHEGGPRRGRHPDSANATRGFWGNADWIYCRGVGKMQPSYRPVEPGTFPLAPGITRRMDKLRAYGNAINAEQARHFIESYRECLAAQRP